MFVGAAVTVGKGGFAATTPLNQALFYLGVFGGVVAARVFGMGVQRTVRGPSRGVPLVIGLAMPLAAAAIAVAIGVRTGSSLGLVALMIIVAVLSAGLLLGRTATRGHAQPGAQPITVAISSLEWRLPRWVDVMGSWLFGRFRREGWRIRFERDLPAAMAAAQINLSAAALEARRVRGLAARASPSAAPGAAEARRLAADLLAECRRAEHQLKPLLAKVARLSEGVLVSRTIAAGGSLESELDKAEREADLLRAHARECGEMLQALSAGLEAVLQGQDTARLDAALERARQLSSGVRRAMLRAEVT
jgi:hypothetical protein